MSTDRTPGSATRRILSMAAIILGALLLLVMPLTLIFLAVTSKEDAQLPGTLVIVSATGGMMLLAIGAVLRD